jgi:oligoribonuclease
MTDTPDKILWCDLECTGSNVDKDEIIEIGLILTDQDLNELGYFKSVVKPGPLALGRLMQNSVVHEMHTVNGLLDDVLGADDIYKQHIVTTTVLLWLRSIGVGVDGRNLILAGSGVGHYDKRFIDKYMPQLSKLLRYYVLDVGVIRRAHRMWVGEPEDFNSSKTHRALDDIKAHLGEARYYRSMWRDQAIAQSLVTYT